MEFNSTANQILKYIAGRKKYQSSFPNSSCMTAILSTKLLFVDSGKKYSQFLSHDSHLSKLSPSPFFSFCVRPAFCPGSDEI